MDGALDAVRRELAELRARVESLEAAVGGAVELRPIAGHQEYPVRAQAVGRQLDAEVRAKEHSSLFFLACALREPSGRVLTWAGETATGAEGPQATPEALQDVARAHAALGNEARLRLMQMLWRGEKTAAELAEASGLSTGSLYHHMRELYAARWVEMPQRNRYRLTIAGRKALVAALAVTPHLL